MKKLLYVLCGVVVFCSSCNRMNVCEETIEKLQLTENGFCNISLGEDVYSIVGKLGDVNPADYSIGADKGGAVSLFDDFDIDYNQMKYLIETRCSGALTVPFSAVAIEFVSATV